MAVNTQTSKCERLPLIYNTVTRRSWTWSSWTRSSLTWSSWTLSYCTWKSLTRSSWTRSSWSWTAWTWSSWAQFTLTRSSWIWSYHPFPKCTSSFRAKVRKKQIDRKWKWREKAILFLWSWNKDNNDKWLFYLKKLSRQCLFILRSTLSWNIKCFLSQHCTQIDLAIFSNAFCYQCKCTLNTEKLTLYLLK